jgi:hypothetical protein
MQVEGLPIYSSTRFRSPLCHPFFSGGPGGNFLSLPFRGRDGLLPACGVRDEWSAAFWLSLSNYPIDLCGVSLHSYFRANHLKNPLKLCKKSGITLHLPMLLRFCTTRSALLDTCDAIKRAVR